MPDDQDCDRRGDLQRFSLYTPVYTPRTVLMIPPVSLGARHERDGRCVDSRVILHTVVSNLIPNQTRVRGVWDLFPATDDQVLEEG